MKHSATALAAASLAIAAASLHVDAKLPPPDPAAKAKADEAKAKAAWQAKVDAYQLCKSQDRIAALYKKTHANDANASGAKPAASSPSAAASQATPKPVASTAPPPCADPGPFAYNPPDQTPLESSGAHSPAGNAASPPSVRQESGQMTHGTPAAK